MNEKTERSVERGYSEEGVWITPAEITTLAALAGGLVEEVGMRWRDPVLMVLYAGISAGMPQEFRRMNPEVLAGSDRYATALALAVSMAEEVRKIGAPETVEQAARITALADGWTLKVLPAGTSAKDMAWAAHLVALRRMILAQGSVEDFFLREVWRR